MLRRVLFLIFMTTVMGAISWLDTSRSSSAGVSRVEKIDSIQLVSDRTPADEVAEPDDLVIEALDPSPSVSRSSGN